MQILGWSDHWRKYCGDIWRRPWMCFTFWLRLRTGNEGLCKQQHATNVFGSNFRVEALLLVRCCALYKCSRQRALLEKRLEVMLLASFICYETLSSWLPFTNRAKMMLLQAVHASAYRLFFHHRILHSEMNIIYIGTFRQCELLENVHSKDTRKKQLCSIGKQLLRANSFGWFCCHSLWNKISCCASKHS